MTLPLLPLPHGVWPPLPAMPLPPLMPPVQPDPWRVSPDVNPTQPGWYLTRWRQEFPQAKLYWDGVWWCVEMENTGLQRLSHVNIRNWSCEWKPLA